MKTVLRNYENLTKVIVKMKTSFQIGYGASERLTLSPHRKYKTVIMLVNIHKSKSKKSKMLNS